MNLNDFKKYSFETNLISKIQSKIKKEILFAGVIGSQVWGLSDKKSDIDLFVYVRNTLDDLLLGKQPLKEFDLEDNIHVKVIPLNFLYRSTKKVAPDLIESIYGLIYLTEESRGLIRELFKIYETDFFKSNLERATFFKGFREFKELANNKIGSKKEFQVGDLNYKSLSKCYLYKKVLEDESILKVFSENSVTKEVEQIYREIRQFQISDEILKEIQDFYKDSEQKEKYLKKVKIEDDFWDSLSRVIFKIQNKGEF